MKISVSHRKLDRVYEVDVDKVIKETAKVVVPMAVGVTALTLLGRLEPTYVEAFKTTTSGIPSDVVFDSPNGIMEIVQRACKLCILREQTKCMAAKGIVEAFKVMR